MGDSNATRLALLIRRLDEQMLVARNLHISYDSKREEAPTIKKIVHYKRELELIHMLNASIAKIVAVDFSMS
jgi:hypothetical protein